MLYFAEGQTFDPYFNLAMEKWLCDHLEGQLILYLWQNEHTVVIGKNQNPLKECRLAALRQDGGLLARRCSGGGAVYHDLGNLNFTILMPSDQFDLHKQCSVLLQAVRQFGINAQFSGRNDLTVEGRKFSGNAFYHGPYGSFHHGTLLVDTDGEKVGRYLRVSQAKLKGNGVDSVRRRIINLKECAPDITIDKLKTALREVMQQVYGQPGTPWSWTAQQLTEIRQLANEYQSEAWLLPDKFQADLCLEKRFGWGEIQVQLQLQPQRITACRLYSDAMDEVAISTLQQLLQDCPLIPEALHSRALKAAAEHPLISECIAWISQEIEGQESTW